MKRKKKTSKKSKQHQKRRKIDQSSFVSDVEFCENPKPVIKFIKKKGPAVTRTIPLSAAKLKLPEVKKLRFGSKTKFHHAIKKLVKDCNLTTYKISLVLNAVFHCVDDPAVRHEVEDLQKLYHAIYPCRYTTKENSRSTPEIGWLKYRHYIRSEIFRSFR